MDQEKLKSAFGDKAFAEKIVKLQTPEEVQAAFKEKGIEISVEEVQLLGSIINKMVEKKNTDLSEEDLEGIAGGEGKWDSFKVGVKSQGYLLKAAAEGLISPPKSSSPEEQSITRASAAGILAPLAGGAAVMFAAGVGLAVGVPWAYKKIKGAISSRRSKK